MDVFNLMQLFYILNRTENKLFTERCQSEHEFNEFNAP